ncbi:hypothetical protein EVAR_50012_1 [Eumeta japonica]|uniref:Uncharacterized protein n=1 Tax=Eumeta variegata TaxID=151549 RepID=A0A4C1XSL3_EUMVA|nr:hypothetical protein EVAR_50012_1 [Eumeta japonica]
MTEDSIDTQQEHARDSRTAGTVERRQLLLGNKLETKIFALQQAITRKKNGKNRLFNIFSDSKSSLQMFIGLKIYNPVAHAAKRDILDIVAEGWAVRLFWERAHAGTEGNEHADYLAGNAALKKKMTVDYDRFLLSFAKKTIRAASLKEW